MNRPVTTRDAILTYIRASSQPSALLGIERYMKMMFRVEAGAVREQLHRLVNAGVLDRVALGVYALKAGA